MSGAILLVEDERTLGRAISLFLEGCGFVVEWVQDAEAGLAAFERQRPDFVLTDVRLPGMSGTDLFARLRALDPAVPVAVMTAHGTIESAVAAMKHGAFDYLKKPVDLDELKLLADRAMEQSRRGEELAVLRDRASVSAGAGDVVGAHPAFLAILDRARQLAELGDVPPVLITGETGTGKSLVARTLHSAGVRADRAFIDVNCTTLPASLAEAELFGHERGAFTDAKQSRLGLFEAADGGFLFLDEIGDLDLAIQGKLLKAIEDGLVRRLGGTRERTVDVRIIAATNRDLRAECERQTFRQDLFFRIAVMTLHMPPLRERGDDVLLLAEHYLARTARRYGRAAPRLGAGAAEALRAYPWPGNVRELSHVMERAVLWHAGGLLDGAALATAIGSMPASAVLGSAASLSRTDLPAASDSGDLLVQERAMLDAALRESGGNQTRAAQRLGISRDTLRYRLKKFGL